MHEIPFRRVRDKFDGLLDAVACCQPFEMFCKISRVVDYFDVLKCKIIRLFINLFRRIHLKTQTLWLAATSVQMFSTKCPGESQLL